MGKEKGREEKGKEGKGRGGEEERRGRGEEGKRRGRGNIDLSFVSPFFFNKKRKAKKLEKQS